jgi:hypothetical protein
MNVKILFHNAKPISVEIPPVVELKVIETPPAFKGIRQREEENLQHWKQALLFRFLFTY